MIFSGRLNIEPLVYFAQIGTVAMSVLEACKNILRDSPRGGVSQVSVTN